ncbi:MAG: hypothetical protein IPM46_09790 [Flavobacteriales bacterium]|nr:hypothetical protein [Flavobacteriales bacterium]
MSKFACKGWGLQDRIIIEAEVKVSSHPRGVGGIDHAERMAWVGGLLACSMGETRRKSIRSACRQM